MSNYKPRTPFVIGTVAAIGGIPIAHNIMRLCLKNLKTIYSIPLSFSSIGVVRFHPALPTGYVAPLMLSCNDWTIKIWDGVTNHYKKH